MIDVVVEQTMYLERIVQDLLLLAHDEPTQMTLHAAEWRIEPLVENAILSSQIGRINVATEIESGLIAFVDADRLQQILVNLLTNAGRYGGDSCLVVARGIQGHLVVEVHDAGPGVPKKYELTIWDRFERGPNRYNAAVPGTGIGLAMVKSIAIAHGGRASYRRSDRLGGACFIVEFPGRVADAAPVAIVQSTTMAIG
jgi:signal transduction histidine kinase